MAGGGRGGARLQERCRGLGNRVAGIGCRLCGATAKLHRPLCGRPLRAHDHDRDRAGGWPPPIAGARSSSTSPSSPDQPRLRSAGSSSFNAVCEGFSSSVASRSARPVDPAQDQALLRARRGDVDQPARLLGLGGAVLLTEVNQFPEAKRIRRGDRQPHAEARPRWVAHIALEPADGDVRRAASRAQAATQVGDCDNRELEPLGGMHSHHPDAVMPLHLNGGHALALVAPGALLRELQKAAQVATVMVLVLAGQPHQLADVRHPPASVGLRQERQVVVEGRDRAINQRVERTQWRFGAQASEDLAKPLQPTHIGRRHRGWPLTVGDRWPNVPRAAVGVPGGLAQEPQGVGADAAGRRGKGAEQELVVERVGDDAEQPQRVLDLLLRPVAATADDVRCQPGAVERLLERVDVGEGAQQHDHLPTRHPLVGQLPQALGEEARLGDVRRVGLRGRGGELDLLRPPAALGTGFVLGGVRQQELGGRATAARLGVGLEPGLERRESRQQRGPGEIDRSQDVGARAEVAAQRHPLRRGIGLSLAATLAEHLQVGVTEPVDGLELVSHREQPCLRPA